MLMHIRGQTGFRRLSSRLVAVIGLAHSLTTPGAEAKMAGIGKSTEAGATMVRIKAEALEITAILEDNATAWDFVSLLPMSVTLKDYAKTEKVTYLPKKLSTEGSPRGSDPDAGDIGYYAPWGNLAFYYKDFGYSDGLIKLGRMDSGFHLLKGYDSLEVTIELIKRR
jgi:hypothetical protein